MSKANLLWGCGLRTARALGLLLTITFAAAIGLSTLISLSNFARAENDKQANIRPIELRPLISRPVLRRHFLNLPSSSASCRSFTDAQFRLDCFKSEYDVNSQDARSNHFQNIDQYPAFTKLEALFDSAPKAQQVDIGDLELQAIMAALPAFHLAYGEVNGRRIGVRDEGEFIKVHFYDPNAPSGCLGNCGRGGLTVILSKPGLHYVRSIFPR